MSEKVYFNTKKSINLFRLILKVLKISFLLKIFFSILLAWQKYFRQF
jgi:hypothetical protein